MANSKAKRRTEYFRPFHSYVLRGIEHTHQLFRLSVSRSGHTMLLCPTKHGTLFPWSTASRCFRVLPVFPTMSDSSDCEHTASCSQDVVEGGVASNAPWSKVASFGLTFRQKSKQVPNIGCKARQQKLVYFCHHYPLHAWQRLHVSVHHIKQQSTLIVISPFIHCLTITLQTLLKFTRCIASLVATSKRAKAL